MTVDRSEFFSIFHEEAKDILQKLNAGLLVLEKDPQNAQIIEAMFREAHTLKGTSRMMGFHEINEVSHCIEDVFSSIHNKQTTLDPAFCTLLFQALDMISVLLEESIGGKTVSAPWEKMLSDLKQTVENVDPSKKKNPKEKNP
jgi:chemotaxis protein histidine kinase CheA